MKGVQIFQHSLRQVFNNLPAALKISGVLYLVQVVAGLVFGRAMMAGGMDMMAGGGFGLGALLVMILSLFTSIWIAIAWHRFVLLGEVPTTPVPPFMAERMGAYFVKALLIGIAIIVVSMVLGAIVSVVAMPLMMRGMALLGLLLLAILVQVPMIFLGLSTASALPGTALDKKLPFMAGWEATKDDWKSILQLALIMAVLVWVFNLVTIYVFGGFGVMAQIWQAIVGWPVMMVGLSVLTTLYGHYIEKRPLV